MKPGHLLAIQDQASRDWPDVARYKATLRSNGATPEEAEREARTYRAVLFGGHWPEPVRAALMERRFSDNCGDDQVITEDVLALLNSFRIGD